MIFLVSLEISKNENFAPGLMSLNMFQNLLVYSLWK